jgi:hypothetical protein
LAVAQAGGMEVMQAVEDRVEAQQDMQQQLPEQAQLDRDLQAVLVQEKALDMQPVVEEAQGVLDNLE